MTVSPITKIAVGKFLRAFVCGMFLLLPGQSKSQSFVDPMDRYRPRPFQFTPISQYGNPVKGMLPANPLPVDPLLNIPQPGAIPAPVNSPEVEQQAIIERERMLNKELMEDEMYKKYSDFHERQRPYIDAYKDLIRLDPQSFSITRAQFDIENAELHNKFSYAQFLDGVKLRATLVKQILKREGLKANSLSLNYGIQKLYQQENVYYDSVTKQTISVLPLKYDFEDYNGEKDLTQLFTSKLMTTNKGQCLSMPRLYLMIAEQLGAKAWLSLAPQHTYIQFAGDGDKLRSFETTNGWLVSSQWIAQSGYINTKAVRSRTYLDTLSKKQLYAQCLADLLYNYLQSFPYDDFAEQVKQQTLRIDPKNMRALLIDAVHKQEIALAKITAAGKPKPEDLQKYPDAYQAYLNMKAAISEADNLGYQDIPPEAYQKWLRSIDQEKKREANKALRDRMRREIEGLKRMHSTLTNKLTK